VLELSELLRHVVEQRASDLHLKAGSRPFVDVPHRAFDARGGDLAAHGLIHADFDCALALGVRRHGGNFLGAGQGDFLILGARQAEARREQRREGGALEN